MFLAFVLLEANTQLGFAEYVINAVKPWMNASLLPVLSFLVVGALAFATGSLWGIAAIAMPIIFPLANAIDVNMFLTIGAVVSGAVFGSHCCFYTDATLLSARSCQIEPMDHALSQIPYGLIGAGVSVIIYIILGIAM
jgi:Na+/H+ antiporter NhaC